MSSLIDARPAGLNLKYRAGDPLTVVLNWPTGTLTGRTFTATLGAASLAVSILGDVMSITATPAQTAAAAEVEAFELIDTTAVDDVTVIVGRWRASDSASALHDFTVIVTNASGDVEVTLQGMSTVGDLVVAGTLTVEHPLVFWQHPVSVTIPNDIWTPLPFNSLQSTIGPLSAWTSYVPASTTIAAGSNGAVLPQGTINVASTAGFASSGYLVVRISGTDRVVRYTGLNATQFTGCTLGVGTLATGQAIAQANVVWNVPAGVFDRVGPAVAEAAFTANANGDRGIRYRDCSLPFEFLAGTKTERACASKVHHIQTCEQPKTSATGTRVEVIQDSGGTLDSVVDQLAAPRLVIQALSSIA